ncbi:MAG TPA: carboxypeptidase-like regulatory domain-containing protein, partial [Candidatus Acidoferrum sp.]|nr:carboxypeptidase-like regulatory domain-containing protein [Candidatus Acidoferrum sp.]
MRNVARKHIALAVSFFGAVVLALLPPALHAQNPTGALLVTVQDSSGARVAGASVALTQEKFGISRAGKADAQGETRFESLQPGNYTVTVNATGFAETTAAVVVAVSSQPMA